MMLMKTTKSVSFEYNIAHKSALRAIRQMLNKLSASERREYAEQSTYVDCRGKEQPLFNLTKKGYFLLTLGFTGKKTIKKRKKRVLER